MAIINVPMSKEELDALSDRLVADAATHGKQFSRTVVLGAFAAFLLREVGHRLLDHYDWLSRNAK